jgi:hypothetical protein
MGGFSHRSPKLGNNEKFEDPKWVVLKIEVPHLYEILTICRRGNTDTSTTTGHY